MNVKLSLPELKQQLNSFAPIVSKNPSLSVLSSVLFDFHGSNYSITASNLDIQYRVTGSLLADSQVESQKRFAVPYYMLNEIVKTLKSDIISFSLEDNYLEIRWKDNERSYFRVSVLDAEEYPLLDSNKEASSLFTITKEKLVKVFNLTKSITPQSELGCFVTAENGVLTFAKTDGFRLLLYRDREIFVERDFSFQIVLDDRLYGIFSRLKDNHSDIEVKICENVVVFDAGLHELSVRQLATTFPDYKSVMPQSFDFVVGVDSRALLFCINKAMIVDRNTVKFIFDGNTMTVQSGDFGEGSYEECLDIQVLKKPSVDNTFEIYFNPVFFKDTLPKIESDCFHFKFPSTDGTKPLVIVPEDNDNVMYLVMPKRV